MSRRLASLVVALAFLAGTAKAADAKPKIAILGIEVIATGDIDEQATMVAKNLTDALRRRAQMGKGPYALAPNSNKDLLELKLLSNCSDEGRGCMSEIGKELGADRLMYGKIERRDNGFQVSLKLLDTQTRTMERTTSDLIPFSDAKTSLESWAKSLYNRLTGVPESGTLLVRSNTQRGTVYIDGDVMGSLSAGTARITGLEEGEHEIVVESEGYDKFTGTVQVSGGGTEETIVELRKAGGGGGGGGGGGESRPGRASRALFWTTLVATGASATAMTITGLQVRGSLEDDKRDAIRALRDMDDIDLPRKNACGAAKGMADLGNPRVDAVIDACDDGKRKATITNVLIGTTVVSAIAASYFYYAGYVKHRGAKESETALRKRERDRVTVTPAIGPTTVGGSVEIRF